ncbi:uncharacterized protein LOC114333083 isoform X1 [Diabrotica virgifera virgifera]|uniref:DUF7869 domain-containing protein n=1 Tax=Diabrotica virgifera virgifera TaxID=50390 RepID=A0ABM5KMP2_DIAVI|nr:uncharacterized protein LOC114333083 isoform X1 [Diabrotica virgifera virgifera]
MTMDYTIEKCYEVYKIECLSQNQECVSADKFRRVFTEDFNIKFKSPKSDTCHICDSIYVSMKEATIQRNEEQIQALQLKQELHHRKAKAGQDAIKNATKTAQENNETYAITFDLQQALPTPKLSTGPTFYKKKLFSYNLGIDSLYPSQGYFYLWDESTAARGADEIGSCLLKHFQIHNIKGHTLIAISDNCIGQNKNWSLVGVWLRLLALGNFKEIIHIFPQVGHTMLPSDRDFAVVEKYVRAHCQYVYSPAEWENILRTCQRKNPFIVYKMNQEDFLKVSEMRNYFVQPKSTPANPCSIRNAVRMRFSAENFEHIEIADTYNGEFNSYSIQKRERTGILQEHFIQDLQKKYATRLGIEPSKLEHVLSCLEWIPSVHHEFYRSLFAKSL